MNRNIRKLTDGAMMCAIVGAILLINRQTGGLLEGMALFLFPLPMVFYSAKYGMKDSWTVFAAMVILGFILGSVQTMFYVGSESLIGLVYGSGIYKKTDAHVLTIRTMILAAIADIMTMLVFASFFGYDLAAEAEEMQTMMSEVFESSGVTALSETMISRTIRTSMIVATIFTGLMEGYITHVVSRLMLKRLRFPVEPASPIQYYYPPKWAGYLGMAGFLLYMIVSARQMENGNLQIALQSIGTFGMFYLAFFGFIANLLAGKELFPKMSPVILAILDLLLLFFLSPIYSILGFLYITTDFHDRLLKGDFGHASENQ